MRKFILLICLFILPALACNLPGQALPEQALPEPAASAQVPPEQSVAQASPAAGEQAAPIVTAEPSPTPTPTPRPNQPVSLRSGLAGLNSYRFSMYSKVSGTGAEDWTEIITEIQYDQALDAQLISTRSLSGGMEPGESASETRNYQIGLEVCNESDGEWEFSTLAPAEKEMVSLNGAIMDFVPLIENPQFIGQEELNGVLSAHYSFQVSGLGSQSGAEVSANQGEYWMAEDGEYLVRYTLRVELRPDPDTSYAQEYRLETGEINQPQAIAFPPECLQAKNNPE